MRNGTLMVAAALLLAPLAAGAQTYRCTGKDGKKYYGQSVPVQCIGQPVEQLNAQGMVVKRIDAQVSAEERAKKDAEENERKKRETISKEQGRRDRALLENEKAVKEIEARVNALKKRRTDLVKDMEFFQGKNKPPAKMQQDITNSEIDMKGQESLLAAKQKEVDLINAKYDDDKKRYLELTKGR